MMTKWSALGMPVAPVPSCCSRVSSVAVSCDCSLTPAPACKVAPPGTVVAAEADTVGAGRSTPRLRASCRTSASNACTSAGVSLSGSSYRFALVACCRAFRRDSSSAAARTAVPPSLTASLTGGTDLSYASSSTGDQRPTPATARMWNWGFQATAVTGAVAPPREA